MADAPGQTNEQKLRRIGLYNTMTGMLPAGFVPSEGEIDFFLEEQIRYIESNTTYSLGTDGPSEADPFAGPAQGLHDRIFSLIDSQQADTALSEQDIEELEALLGAQGYQATQDGSISGQEELSLEDLETRLRAGESLTDIANRNFSALNSRAQLNASVAASLVDTGYLDIEDIGDTAATQWAMRRFIDSKVHPSEQLEHMAQSFDPATGLPTDYASAFLLINTIGAQPQRLQELLESGDPAQITIAQNFINVKYGMDLPTDGVMTPETYDAGLMALRAPVMPHTLINAEGEINHQEAYNNPGAYPSPVELLTAEQLETYNALPAHAEGVGLSRETYAILRAAENPEAFREFIDAHNAERASATLDAHAVAVELPVVETGATTGVEDREAANNPLGIVAEPDALVIGAAMTNEGIGQTDSFGLIVFEDTDASIQAAADLFARQEVPTSMESALRIVYYASETSGSVIAGAMSGADETSLYAQAGQRITEQLGYEYNHEFDLSNPEEMRAMLIGLHAFRMRQELEGSTADTLVESLREQRPEIIEGINRVTTPQAEAPAVEAVPEGALSVDCGADFRAACSLVIPPGDPALSPDPLLAANTNRNPVLAVRMP